MKLILEHKKYLLFILVIMLILTSLYALNFNIITSHGDNSLYVSLANKILDPELYEKDFFLNQYTRILPYSFALILSILITIFQSVKFAYLILYFFLFLTFLISIYFLAFYIIKNKTAAFLVTLINIPGKRILGGSYWGLTSTIIPQIIVLALSPIILLFFLKNYKDYKKILILYFILGLLANIHFLSVAILIFILSVTYFLNNRNLKSIKFLFLFVLVFIIGALPYIIFQSPSTEISSLEVLKIRAAVAFITPLKIIKFIGYSIFAIILGLIGYNLKNKKNKKETDTLMKYFLSASIFLVLISLVTSQITSLLKVQIARASSYILLFLYIYSGYFMYLLILKKGALAKAILPILILLLMILPVPTSNNNLIPTFIQDKYKNIYDNFKYNFYPDLGDFVDVNDDRESFYDLSSWANKNTLKNSLFLVPPGFEAFRSEAKRSVLVTQKDGGVSLYSSYGDKWYNLYKKLIEIYKTGSTKEFNDFAKENDVDYIITEKDTNLVLKKEYENKRYIVYSI